MPLLYSLGQHSALEVTQEELTEDECLLDIYVVSPDPDWGSHVYPILQRHLHSARGSALKEEDAGLEPKRDQASGMRRVGEDAQAEDLEARVWRGAGGIDSPPERQGIVVLGTPLWETGFIQAHLERKWHGFHLWEIYSLRG